MPPAGIVAVRLLIDCLYQGGHDRSECTGSRMNRGDVLQTEAHEFGDVAKAVAQIRLQTLFVDVNRGGKVKWRSHYAIVRDIRIPNIRYS
jgi:hypothetical protein